MDKLETEQLKKNKSKIIKICAIAAVSYCNLLAFGKLFDTIGLSSEYEGPAWFGYNALQFLFLAADIFLLYRFIEKTDKRQRVFSIVFGLLAAILTVCGTYLLYKNDLFIGLKEAVKVILMSVGISFMAIPLWSVCIEGLNKAEDLYMSQKADAKQDESRHIGYFFLMQGLIILCYLPVLLSQWPGNFVYDAADEMRDYINFLEEHSISNHHTIVHPLLMGSCYSLGGKLFGSVSVGFGIYTTIQMLAVTAALAYLLWYFRIRKVPAVFRICAFLAAAFFPVYKWFSITATKDVLCGAFALIFAVGMMRLFYDKEKLRWYGYAGIVISGILSCLFRNNMIYAIVVGGALLVVFQKKWRARLVLLALIAGIFIGQKASTKILFKAVNAYAPDTYRESMSVPLQCLARVSSYRKDELPDDLYEEITMYIPEYKLESGYSPFISDDIKASANETLLKNNKTNFIKLWVKVGLKFPDEYAESILSNTMAYWYPINLARCIIMDFASYHKLIENGEQIAKHSFMPQWVNDIYDYYYYWGNYRNTPILGYIFRPVLYIWTLIFGAVYSIYKKDWKKLSVFVIPAMYFGTCILGPVVALRYIFPIIAIMPIFAMVLLEKKAEEKQTN